MADKRQCYAGDLTSDAIGKHVVAGNLSGVLTSVKHRFVNGMPSTMVHLNEMSTGWVLGEYELVEVQS